MRTQTHPWTGWGGLRLSLLVALVLAVLPWCIGTGTRAGSAHERWEADVRAMELADKKQAPAQGGVVFVGSSSIRMWKTLREDFPGWAVVNRGFGGSQLADTVYFFERLVYPLKPRVIVVYAGVNDIHAGKTPEAVADDFRRLAEKVRVSLPGTRLAYISIAGNPARWGEIDRVREANRLIRLYAKSQRHTGFIDVHSAMLAANGEPLPDIFVQDRLHMNPKGYAIWREVVGKALVPWMEKR